MLLILVILTFESYHSDLLTTIETLYILSESTKNKLVIRRVFLSLFDYAIQQYPSFTLMPIFAVHLPQNSQLDLPIMIRNIHHYISTILATLLTTSFTNPSYLPQYFSLYSIIILKYSDCVLLLQPPYILQVQYEYIYIKHAIVYHPSPYCYSTTASIHVQ